MHLMSIKVDMKCLFKMFSDILNLLKIFFPKIFHQYIYQLYLFVVVVYVLKIEVISQSFAYTVLNQEIREYFLFFLVEAFLVMFFFILLKQ